MKRYLLATNFDLRKHFNSRDHNLVRWHSQRCEETWVIYRHRCERGGWRQVLKDALLPHALTYERDGVHYLEVSPLFNHYQGLARDLAGTAGGDGAPEQRQGAWLRGATFLIVSGLGLIKDLAVIGSFCYFGLRRVPGRFEVCTAVGPWAAAAAWVWRRVGKVAAFVYEDIDYEPGFIPTPLRSRWTAWLERFGMARADAVVSVGYRLARLREQQLGSPIRVIPNGVDSARFAGNSPRPESPVLVYAGNATYWSGLDLVVEALPAIREVLPSTHLSIVGESPPGYRASLESLAQRLGVAAAVTFTGRLPYEQVALHLAAAHLGLALFRPIPLRTYAFPLKVVEYMAAGLPTIATEGSETEDLLARHDCGVSVPYARDSFARAAICLLQDPARLNTLAHNARTAAVNLYDWARLMQQDWEVVCGCGERARRMRGWSTHV